MMKTGLNYSTRLGWIAIALCIALSQPSFYTSCGNAWGSETRSGESGGYPKRVISLGPIITENIYLLGAQDVLIADTSYCVAPPEARKKEKVGSLIQMNVEKVIRLNPDLVLGSSFTKTKQIKMLEKFHIKVIKFQNPKTFNDICAMTLKIGQILGKEENAQKIVTLAGTQVDAIIKKTTPLKKKKVFFQIGIKPIHTPMKGTFVNEYIEFAGAVNIADIDPDQAKSEKYNREKVLELNPDIILIAMMGSSRKAAENEKQIWLRFQSINASRNNEIYVLDPDIICSPTPVTFIEALKKIVTIIHHQL